MKLRQAIYRGLATVVPLCLVVSAWANSVTLVTRVEVFNETFSTETYKDPASVVRGWGSGFVSLPSAGANLFDASYQSMPQEVLPAPVVPSPQIQVTQGVPGNFDHNYNGSGSVGSDDLIVLTPTLGCHFHFLKNLGSSGSPAQHRGWDVGTVATWTDYRIVDSDDPTWCFADGVDGTSGTTANAVQLIGGDFDGDGYRDLLYLRSEKRNYRGDLVSAHIFINQSSPTTLANGVEVPTFTRTDLNPAAGALSTANIKMHWSGDLAVAVDWDDDGRDEVLVASSGTAGTRIVLLNPSLSGTSITSFTEIISNVPVTSSAIASTSNQATQGSGCDGSVARGRGVTAFAVGKFNTDDKWDIVAGSISETGLYYWPSNSDGSFPSTPESLVFSPGGAMVLQVADWDLDGDVDFVVGRSSQGCNGSATGGEAWVFSNSPNPADPENESTRFSQGPSSFASLGSDLDYGFALNLDNDAESTSDLMLGEAAAFGDLYYYFYNKRPDIYERTGSAVSRIVSGAEINVSEDLIVSARLLSASVTGLTVTTPVKVYVSNDDGRNWVELSPAELPQALGGTVTPAEVKFKVYGNELRWKMEFEGPESTMVGAAQIALLNQPEYLEGGLSKVTAKVSSLGWEYTVVQGQHIYSRSKLAQKIVRNSQGVITENIVYSAAFEYPGFRGFVRAYDLTNLGSTESSVINPGDNPHLSSHLQWEAGAVSKQTGAGMGRVLYSAADNDGNGTFEQTLTLNDNNLLTGSNPLAGLMEVTPAEGGDVLNFLRGGLGDSEFWKLHDVGHSAPVYVGAPVNNSAYPAYSAENYAAFQIDKLNRDGTVYVGTNGGGVHAFRADTGVERWMWVPPNQLSKLKEQRVVDPETSNVKYLHQFFVDSGVFVEDIHDGSNWMTLLVIGQGKGTGKSEGLASVANYYSALDITNPSTPVPLWQFGDGVEVSRDTCSGTGSIDIVTLECDANRNCDDDCCDASHIFGPNANGEIVIEGQNYTVPSTSFHAGVQWSANLCDVSNQFALAQDGSSAGDPYTGCPTHPALDVNGDIIQCGAVLSYSFEVNQASEYDFHFKLSGPTGGKMWASLNNKFLHSAPIAVNGANWIEGVSNKWMGPGTNLLDLWMIDDGVRVEKVIISPQESFNSAQDPAGQCLEQCDPLACSPVTTTVNVSPGAPSPECGETPERQCCTYSDTSDGLDGGIYCRPTGAACATTAPDTALGETWSKPLFARLLVSGAPTWVVFFASGYNNLGTTNVGRTLYALKAGTGETIATWNFDDLDYHLTSNISTIDNTIPGSPAGVDKDGDGLVDAVYLGDLEGRLWRLDTQAVNLAAADVCLLFDAGKMTSASSRRWAPIVNRPAVAVLNKNEPNIYFGTGADDRAPSNLVYQFFSVQDSEYFGSGCPPTKYQEDLSSSRYEWVIGDNSVVCANLSDPNCWGPRYWGDPITVNDSVVYMPSLSGHIEEVDARSSVSGSSRIYGRALRRFRTASGHWVNPGATVFRDAVTGNGIEYYGLSTNARELAVLGQEGTAWAQASNAPKSAQASTRLLVQAYADTDVGTSGGATAGAPVIQESGVAPGSLIKMVRWREVPLGNGCGGGF